MGEQSDCQEALIDRESWGLTGDYKGPLDF